MRRTAAAHAKVARPLLTGVVPRSRLFDRLDRLRDRRVIWVCGPAGCGKTTLVGSYLEPQKRPLLWYQVDAGDTDPATFFYYLGLAARQASPRFRKPLPLLTPEYLPGLRIFVGRYFEHLCGRLMAPAALVFDNLHEVEGDAGFYELLHTGLSRMPPGLTTFLISRHDPPPAFARLLANSEMAVLGWDELRLTPREVADIVCLRASATSLRKHLRDFQSAADGWAAGLVLLLEWATREGVEPEALRRAIPEQLFDYFGNEVFQKIDPATQEFLFKTAVLPRMTAKTAEALTGLPSAGALLARLSSRHAFTEKRLRTEPVYQYHALFREFLLAQAMRVVSPAALAALRRQAAALLEADGETDAAATLLQEASDWNALSALITTHAPSLLAQGRHRALETWLKHLPTEAIAGSPWLQYWRGACTLPFDPSLALSSFERAFAAFKAQGDAAGTLLAWTGAVDATLYGFADFAPMDRWIGELDELSRTLERFPSREIEARVAAAMVMALAFRQPWRPDLETWASRGLAIQAPDAFGTHIQIWWVLGYHGFMMGENGQAALALDHLRQMARSPNYPPLARINAILVEASSFHMMGDHEATLKVTVEGLELARREGIHVLAWISTEHHLAKNQTSWRDEDRLQRSRHPLALGPIILTG